MIIQNNEQWTNYVATFADGTNHMLLRFEGEHFTEVDVFPSYPALVLTHEQETYLVFHYIVEVEDAEMLVKVAKQGVKRFE